MEAGKWSWGVVVGRPPALFGERAGAPGVEETRHGEGGLGEGVPHATLLSSLAGRSPWVRGGLGVGAQAEVPRFRLPTAAMRGSALRLGGVGTSSRLHSFSGA